MSSKLRADKISFDDSEDFVVGSKKETVQSANFEETTIDESELILNRARAHASEIISNAQKEAQELISRAQKEVEELKNEHLEKANLEAQKIIETAQNQAQILSESATSEANLNIENSRKEANLLLENSKEQIELERIEMAKKGYEEGYKDAQEKLQEELEEKIQSFDDFCAIEFEIKNKILKAAGKDIFDIIECIVRKILDETPEPSALEKIIKNAVGLLEKKENITIILSEKYAKILFELQKRALSDGAELKFEEFKQYENFKIVYNKTLDDDTIIVENLTERLDASIKSQLDVIIRDILKSTKNGYLDVAQYLEKDE